MPFIKTDSDLLLQPKLIPLSHVKSISKWIALLVSYLAYIWSQLRHVYSKYFCFRKIKSRLESFEKTDASIISYPMTSERECKRKFIAEWGDVKSQPFVFSIPKSFSLQD